MERSLVEWTGVEWRGVEWSGVDSHKSLDVAYLISVRRTPVTGR